MPKKKMTLKEFTERYECCYSAAGVRLKKLIAKDKKFAKHVSRKGRIYLLDEYAAELLKPKTTKKTSVSSSDICNYDCLMSFKDDSVVKMVEEIKDLMVDVLCGERTVISEGKRVSEETAKAAYRKITFEHVQYVLHSLVNYPDKISRIDRFLTTSLFNSVYTLMNSTFAGFEHDMGMKLLC